MPDTILSGGMKQVILYRLEKIPKQQQTTLHLAAVQGRWIDLDLLQQFMSDKDTEEWLAVCSEAMVLDTQDEQWRFAHDKLREGILESLDEKQKRILNQQVAEAIEIVYADDLESYSAILTQHWHEAQNHEKEAHYAFMAGKLAKKNNAFKEALHLFQRTYSLYENRVQPNRKTLADVAFEVSSTLMRLSSYDEARTWLDKTLGMYQALEDKAGIRDVLGNISDIEIRGGNYDKAKDILNQSLAMSRELDDKKRIAQDLMHLGNLAQSEHRFDDALAIRQESYELMKEAGDPLDICKTLNNLALSYDFLGEIEQAMKYHREALAIRRAVNDPYGIAMSLINMGAIVYDQKDYKTALAYGTEALELFRAMDNQFAVSYALGLLGDVAHGQQRLNDAKIYYEESLSLRRKTKDKSGVAASLNALGKIAIEAQDYQQAWDYYTESLEIRHELNIMPNILTQLKDFTDLLIKLNQHELAYLIFATLAKQDELPKSIENLESQLEEIKTYLSDDIQSKLDKEAQTITVEDLSQQILATDPATLFQQV